MRLEAVRHKLETTGRENPSIAFLRFLPTRSRGAERMVNDDPALQGCVDVLPGFAYNGTVVR